MSELAVRTFREDMPIELLDRPALDARLDRDPAELEALSRDIARRGVILPAIAFVKGDRFELVDGTSRWLASKMANKTTMPCFVYPSKAVALEGVKYACNIFRLDMTPAEEAVYFCQLFMHECHKDVDQVCALVNQTRGYVESRLLLAQGDEAIFEAVRRKEIKLGVAALLNTINDETYRHYYLRHAIQDGATVSTVQGWVQQYQIMQGPNNARGDVPSTAAIAIQAAEIDPNKCCICGKNDHGHAIRWVPIHTHCQLAILDPLLTAYRGESA